MPLLSVAVMLGPAGLTAYCLCHLVQVQTSLTDAVLLKPRAAPDGLSSSLVVAAQAAWAQRQQGRRLTAFQKEVKLKTGCAR
jgi:hypothetical protein